ncbi:four helix bundle protein [soil metagenome]
MNREKPGADIAHRMLELAVGVVQAVQRSSRPFVLRHVREQLIRAVTSAGANYEEARHAESRADFIHKVGVSAKELAESLYWLRHFHRLRPHDQLPPLAIETDQLVAILIASRKTASARAPNPSLT